MTSLKVQIAYGETGLEVDLPSDRKTVIVPTHAPPAADPHDAVREALREPMADPALRDSATVEEALAAAGDESTVCVLPEGPQTIPYVV